LATVLGRRAGGAPAPCPPACRRSLRVPRPIWYGRPWGLQGPRPPGARRL